MVISCKGVVVSGTYFYYRQEKQNTKQGFILHLLSTSNQSYSRFQSISQKVFWGVEKSRLRLFQRNMTHV